MPKRFSTIKKIKKAVFGQKTKGLTDKLTLLLLSKEAELECDTPSHEIWHLCIKKNYYLEFRSEMCIFVTAKTEIHRPIPHTDLIIHRVSSPLDFAKTKERLGVPTYSNWHINNILSYLKIGSTIVKPLTQWVLYE